MEKAVALEGKELHGRWLRVQEGKMYLRKWEEAENKKNDIGRWGGGGGSGRGGGEEGMRGNGAEAADERKSEEPMVGGYVQRVKRRKKHGYKE